MSDLQSEADQAAEGERVCAELKHQLDHARELVQEARLVLSQAARVQEETRSFAPRSKTL